MLSHKNTKTKHFNLRTRQRICFLALSCGTLLGKLHLFQSASEALNKNKPEKPISCQFPLDESECFRGIRYEDVIASKKTIFPGIAKISTGH